jgi:hypothetical protein
MPLSRESTNASLETEEEQSAMIPTSSATEPLKRELPPTKQGMRDRHIYLNNTTLIIIYPIAKPIQHLTKFTFFESVIIDCFFRSGRETVIFLLMQKYEIIDVID